MFGGAITQKNIEFAARGPSKTFSRSGLIYQKRFLQRFLFSRQSQIDNWYVKFQVHHMYLNFEGLSRHQNNYIPGLQKHYDLPNTQNGDQNLPKQLYKHFDGQIIYDIEKLPSYKAFFAIQVFLHLTHTVLTSFWP